LSNYEGYTLTETVQCSFVLTALHKNPNYREFVIQFDTTDAGTIKLKDLCGRAVKYFQNTHESWGFNVTSAEHRGNKHDQSKELKKQLNSMQAQIKQLGKSTGRWNTGKRAAPGGGNFGCKKPRKPCVFCKGDHHPGSCNPSSGQLVLPVLTMASRDIRHLNALTRLEGQLTPLQLLPQRNL